MLATSADIVQDLLVDEPFYDHNLITFSVTTSSVLPRKSQKLNYAFRKADWDHLTSLFSYTPWDVVYFDNCLDLNWQAWVGFFFAAVDQCVPKQKSSKKVNAPWITKDLISLRRKKKSGCI